MKKFMLILLLAVVSFAGEYRVSNEKSEIKFEATKLMFVAVEGTFNKFSGSIQTDEQGLTNISGRVEVTSLNTGNETRDKNLKSLGYFNLKNFGTISFESLAIDEHELKASVTIKGISKTLDFSIDSVEIQSDKVILKLSTKVNRNLFELNGSMSALIKDEVSVYATLVAFKK
jgi:polyisoprenoid-binding protein YceI